MHTGIAYVQRDQKPAERHCRHNRCALKKIGMESYFLARVVREVGRQVHNRDSDGERSNKAAENR